MGYVLPQLQLPRPPRALTCESRGAVMAYFTPALMLLIFTVV